MKKPYLFELATKCFIDLGFHIAYATKEGKTCFDFEFMPAEDLEKVPEIDLAGHNILRVEPEDSIMLLSKLCLLVYEHILVLLDESKTKTVERIGEVVFDIMTIMKIMTLKVQALHVIKSVIPLYETADQGFNMVLNVFGCVATFLNSNRIKRIDIDRITPKLQQLLESIEANYKEDTHKQDMLNTLLLRITTTGLRSVGTFKSLLKFVVLQLADENINVSLELLQHFEDFPEIAYLYRKSCCYDYDRFRDERLWNHLKCVILEFCSKAKDQRIDDIAHLQVMLAKWKVIFEFVQSVYDRCCPNFRFSVNCLMFLENVLPEILQQIVNFLQSSNPSVELIMNDFFDFLYAFCNLQDVTVYCKNNQETTVLLLLLPACTVFPNFLENFEQLKRVFQNKLARDSNENNFKRSFHLALTTCAHQMYTETSNQVHSIVKHIMTGAGDQELPLQKVCIEFIIHLLYITSDVAELCNILIYNNLPKSALHDALSKNLQPLNQLTIDDIWLVKTESGQTVDLLSLSKDDKSGKSKDSFP